MRELRWWGARVAPATLGGVLVAFLLAILGMAGEARAASSFASGVAAGDVTSKSARIWTRAPEAGKVEAVLATDKGLRKVVSRKELKAKESSDLTVQKRIGKLKPGRTYRYRFCQGGECSQTGSFETAPGANENAKVRFAYTGDADGTPLPGADEPFFGTFEAYGAMRDENDDFNINLGDTIYSDSGVGGGAPALSEEEKWAKYRQNLTQENLRDLRKDTGLYSLWDDHEFINDFSIPEDGEALYEAGVGAFTDYAPVGYSSKDGLYENVRWGRNAELFFLDERSFRSAKASDGGTCDNPATGAPDLAPTAPPGRRSFFAILIPSLANPVSQACKDAINDPDRTLLGEKQLEQFLEDVTTSNARWKIVINETPIQQFYGLPYDRWEGYAYERVMLLEELEQAKVDHLAFLTTDTHAGFANIVRPRTFDNDVAPTNAPPVAADSPYQDFVVGPVATNTFWAEIDDTVETPGSGELLSQLFFKSDPPDGVGMFCAQGDQNSYGQVTVTKKKLKIEYKSEDGGPVSDVDDSICGPYTLTE